MPFLYLSKYNIFLSFSNAAINVQPQWGECRYTQGLLTIDFKYFIFLGNKFQIPHPLPFQTLIVTRNIPSLGQSSQVKCPTYLSALPLLGQCIDRCIKSSLRKHPFLLALAAGDVSRGGTSVTQRQEFHTDDANQCSHNKSSSHGVLNVNLSNFTCLLVDFGKVLCSSANELQQNSNASSREDYMTQILTVLLEILRVYI